MKKFIYVFTTVSLVCLAPVAAMSSEQTTQDSMIQAAPAQAGGAAPQRMMIQPQGASPQMMGQGQNPTYTMPSGVMVEPQGSGQPGMTGSVQGNMMMPRPQPGIAQPMPMMPDCMMQMQAMAQEIRELHEEVREIHQLLQQRQPQPVKPPSPMRMQMQKE